MQTILLLISLLHLKDFDIRKYKSVAGIVDRLVVGKKIKSRLTDSLETAYRLGSGYLSIIYLSGEIKRKQKRNYQKEKPLPEKPYR